MIEDPEAVARDVVRRLERAWNESNGHGFAAPFAADADFINVHGEHHRTRAAIGAGHQQIFDSIYKNSRVRCRLLQARKLTDDVIAAHYRSDLSVPAGPLAGEHSAIPSFVLVRDGDEWTIATFHNTLIAAE